MSPLPSAIRPFAQALANKLVTEQVLFFTGAGFSANWNHPLGGEVAEIMRRDFKELLKHKRRQLGLRPPKGSPAAEVEAAKAKRRLLRHSLQTIPRGNLPLISELLAQNKCWYIRRYITPDLTGSGLPAPFPPKADLVARSRSELMVGIPHIVLGRLAKEGLIDEVMTVNVDAMHESAFEVVGLKQVTSPDDPALRFPWVEAYRVLSDRLSYREPLPARRAVTLHKIHGCVEATRERVRKQMKAHPMHRCSWSESNAACALLSQANHNFVFTYRELLNWRTDAWARDLVSDRVRNHHVLFAGFAIEDAVSHATFRDIYDEERPTTAQPPLLGSGATSDRLRAQVITVDPPNIHSLNILVAANQQDPLLDERQLYLIQNPGSREEVEGIFRWTYVETMTRLLAQQMRLRAPGLLASWLGEEETDSDPDELIDELVRFLERTNEQCPDFLFDALPTSVRLSWLINDSMLAAGLPETAGPHGGRRRTAYWDRFVLPHYYVPLTGNLAITLQLLRLYQVLIEGCGAEVLAGGWMRVPSTRERGGALLLPLLAKRESNLAVLPRLGLQPPSERIATGLIELRGGNNTAAPTRCDELFGNPGRTSMTNFLPTLVVDRKSLWRAPVPDQAARIFEHLRT